MAKVQKLGKTPKLRRSGRNKQKGKNERQRQRTEANKRKAHLEHIKKHPNDRVHEKAWN